jgi:hypothetical protein
MREDSTSFQFRTHVARLRMIVFDTEPPGSDIEVRMTAQGPKSLEAFYLGESGVIPLAESAVVTISSARGVPERFRADSDFFQIGAYLWWLPGESLIQPREATKLTPEEEKRLRSLGYIQ